MGKPLKQSVHTHMSVYVTSFFRSGILLEFSEFLPFCPIFVVPLQMTDRRWDTTEFQVVILAWDLGRQLAPLTDEIPKSLIPVGNRPILSFTLELVEKASFKGASLPNGAFFNLVQR